MAAVTCKTNIIFHTES